MYRGILYSTSKIEYTKISGKICAYQIPSVDSFKNVPTINRRPDIPSNNSNIIGNYLDGVSITSNGLHIWSFAAGCDCMTAKSKLHQRMFHCDGLEGDVKHQSEYLWKSQQFHVII